MSKRSQKQRKNHSTLTRKELKQKAVDYMGGCCAACGYNKCLAALSFHHLDPNQKDFAISRLISSMPWVEVQYELRKCQILCIRCHVELHQGMLDGYV